MNTHHLPNNEDTDQLQYEQYVPKRAVRAAPKPISEWKPSVQRAEPLTEAEAPDSAALTRPTLPPTQPIHPVLPTAPPVTPLIPPPQSLYALPPAYSRRSSARLLPLVGILTSFAAALIFMLFIGWQLFSSTLNDDSRVVAAQLATPTLNIATFPPATTPPELLIQAWNGTERFNVLLLGLDKRPNDRGTAFRTDSMILISLDPATRSIGVLSIPRDLYVEIPRDTVVGQSYGFQRINTAYFLGERVQEGYGALLAMQAVQYNLGVRVHDYVVFDFQAVINIIDTIGGVEIDVAREIIDREYPDMYTNGYDPLYIAAGRQWMNGDLALKYARSRHGSSDFDRARRQQQVINAVRERIVRFEMLPELIVRAPNLWSGLSGHVRSGLGLEQWIQLALYAKDIPSENIRFGVIDGRYVQAMMWNGMSVLSPNRAVIGSLLVEVFGANYNR